MPRRCAASAGGRRDRGSLAPLPAPAPLAHPPSAGIPAIVAPLRARDPKSHHDGASRLGGYRHCIGETHAELHQHRNVVTDRNGLRTGRPVRRDPRSRRVRQPRDLERGRSPCRDRRSDPHPGRYRRTGRHAARRRTREPPLGLRQCTARPGPAPRPRHRQDRARNERPPTRTGRLRDQVLRTRTPDRPGPEPR